MSKYIKKTIRTGPASRSLGNRFWEKVIFDHSKGACWLWTASTTGAGYGKIGLTRDTYSDAHRLSYTLVNGIIPSNKIVMHSCDEKLCVNPKHLVLGTYKDNTQDMINKGRAKFRFKKTILMLLMSILHLGALRIKADTSWDHLGTSFAAQMLAYGVASRILMIGTHPQCNYDYYYHECQYPDGHKVSYNRTEAVIFSTLITLGATFAYSYLRNMDNKAQLGREVLMNSIGQATSIGAIYAFKF